MTPPTAKERATQDCPECGARPGNAHRLRKCLMGSHRGDICRVISEMLDHPDENGIYKTGIAYEKLDDLILAAERAAAERMRERCARLNESMAAPFESDKRALATAAVLIRALPLENPDGD